MFTGARAQAKEPDYRRETRVHDWPRIVRSEVLPPPLPRWLMLAPLSSQRLPSPNKLNRLNQRAPARRAAPRRDRTHLLCLNQLTRTNDRQRGVPVDGLNQAEVLPDVSAPRRQTCSLAGWLSSWLVFDRGSRGDSMNSTCYLYN